ncbi:MAG: porin family protein [Verrucomicrobiales bacterium]|nr:porin family protein [Verrucomicrobiales bacterium]
MKKSITCFIGAVLTMTSLSVADTEPQYQIKDGQIVPTNAPAFRSDAAPRREQENYVALWGGANVFQHADVIDDASPLFGEKFSLKDSISWAAGVKAGHSWDLGTIDGISVRGKPASWQFSLEGEFIYTAWDNKLKWSGYELADWNLDIYALTVNPVLRFNLGTFRPYFGAGAGAAVVHQYIGNKDLNIEDSSTSVEFVFQGIAGTDIMLNDNWSLFLEYKFLALAEVDYDWDIYGNHLVAAGVKFHY